GLSRPGSRGGGEHPRPGAARPKPASPRRAPAGWPRPTPRPSLSNRARAAARGALRVRGGLIGSLGGRGAWGLKAAAVAVVRAEGTRAAPAPLPVRSPFARCSGYEDQQLELVEPSGWIHVPLTDTHKKPIRTFMIQIAVLANHQNGRDTHMRQIKVYTPVEESSIGKFPRCTTIDFMMYRSIR
uniref:Anaphase-promoting complex subunit 10 n=1 Tax=Strigops habroptila TaxID=2489341 RepID=A0A672V113_STRHB